MRHGVQALTAATLKRYCPQSLLPQAQSVILVLLRKTLSIEPACFTALRFGLCGPRLLGFPHHLAHVAQQRLRIENHAVANRVLHALLVNFLAICAYSRYAVSIEHFHIREWIL